MSLVESREQCHESHFDFNFFFFFCTPGLDWQDWLIYKLFMSQKLLLKNIKRTGNITCESEPENIERLINHLG